MDVLDWFKHFQLSDFYICLLFANVLVLGIKWRRLEATLRPYFFLILLALLTESSMLYTNNFNLPGAEYLNNWIYSAGELSIFGWYFVLLFKSRRSIILTGLIYPAMMVFTLIRLVRNPVYITQANWLSGAGIGVFILFSSLAYFFQLIRQDDMTSLSHHPDFWLNAMNLIFYSGISMLNIGASYGARRITPSLQIVYASVNYLNLLLYIGYLIIFLCFSRKRPGQS